MGRTDGTRLASRLTLAAALLVALAFRVPQLGRRPMHNDEANQACKAGLLQERFEYRYDPVEHHGPTLYYFSMPIAWLTSGREFASTTEATFRIVPVLFGAGLVLLAYLVTDGLGRAGALSAALLTAVSPAMVFYSRFYIQEMLLVFFTFGGVAAGWRYVRTQRLGWALLTGAFLGLMHATKETCVIAYAGMAAALVAAALWGGSLAEAKRLARTVNRRHLAGAVAVALGVSFLFYSSFFTHLRGPIDSVRTYAYYLSRAGGDATHVHPFWTYLELLVYARWGAGPVWSEALIVALAIAGAVAVAVRSRLGGAHPVFVRFLAAYTLFLTIVYSVVPYKTPWCMLSFLHGMILLAGVGAVAIVSLPKRLPLRIAVGLVLALGVFHLGWQAHRASHHRKYCADPRNPYVYAHTSTDLLRLVRRAHEIAEVHPRGRAMLVRVVASPHDTWPLPWYLRSFPNVGYWHEAGSLPPTADAAMVVVSPALEEAVAERLRGRYQAEYYGLRPSVLLRVYIDRDLWDAFLKTRGGHAASPHGPRRIACRKTTFGWAPPRQAGPP